MLWKKKMMWGYMSMRQKATAGIKVMNKRRCGAYLYQTTLHINFINWLLSILSVLKIRTCGLRIQILNLNHKCFQKKS